MGGKKELTGKFEREIQGGRIQNNREEKKEERIGILRIVLLNECCFCGFQERVKKCGRKETRKRGREGRRKVTWKILFQLLG